MVVLAFNAKDILPMKIDVIRKENVAVSRWSGGETREYAIYPPGAVYADRVFDFRISSATIEAIPSVFTQFKGYRRYLAMLDGNLQLTQEGKDQTYTKHQLFTFPSTASITSFTQGTDFNLMLNERIVDEVVEVRYQPFQTEQPFVFLFALQEAEVVVNSQSFQLHPWDCLLLNNPNKKTIDIEFYQQLIVGYWSMEERKKEKQ